MPEPKVLADLLLCPQNADGRLVYLQTGDRRSEMSYAQLSQRAAELGGWFAARGMRPGDPLLIFVRDNRAFVDAFWACQLGGYVAVPLAGGLQSERLRRLQHVTQQFDSPWLFTDRTLYLRSKKHISGSVAGERVCLLEDTGQSAPAADVFAAGADDLAMIQFSSGSTGEPKGVQLTHANLLANVRAITAAADIGNDDVCLSWMPLSHDMGLIGFHLVPLFSGIDQVLMDSERFVRRPVHWLETAAQTGATLLCSPNFGYQHYLKSLGSRQPDVDLSRVRLIFNGAEPVSAAVCRTFLQRLATCGLSDGVMFPVYGLAEASLAVSFPEPGSGLTTVVVHGERLQAGEVVAVEDSAAGGVELVCLGNPIGACEVRICDAAGDPLPPGRVGRVQIRGDNVTRGYYRCPDCDRSAFDGDWLDTGDLGFMSGRGLVISGRSRERIFVDGQNWFPQDIEFVLQDSAAIEPGKVAVTSVRSADNAEDELLVFIQYRGALETFATRSVTWQAALTAATGLHAHAILPVHSLPRTSSGKLKRYRLAEDYAAGQYDGVSEAISSQVVTAGGEGGTAVERRLMEICRGLFPGHALSSDQNLFELGADSLTLVRIHEEIESLYPGRVAVTDLFDHPTIAALADYIDDQSA